MKKILIVDDHDDFRAMVHSYLEKQDLGFSLLEASSGELGIIKALREKPDVILMDIRLPDINGIEAATQIKEYLPNCKIIILTMFEAESFRDVFKVNDVAVAYLGKSELFDKLLPAIKKSLENAPSAHRNDRL